MHELLIIYLSSFSDLTVSTAGAEPFIHLMQCSSSAGAVTPGRRAQRSSACNRRKDRAEVSVLLLVAGRRWKPPWVLWFSSVLGVPHNPYCELSLHCTAVLFHFREKSQQTREERAVLPCSPRGLQGPDLLAALLSSGERSSPFRVKLSLARGAYIEQMQLSSVVLCSSVRCPGVGKAAPCSVALATRRHSEFNH